MIGCWQTDCALVDTGRMGSALPLAVAAMLVVIAILQLRRILGAYRRLTAFSCGFDPDGRSSLVEENAPRSVALAKELERLGFRRLGVLWEKLGPGPRMDTVTFAHSERGGFATLIHAPSGEPHLFFLTGFEGGGAALTGAYERPAEDARDRILTGVPGRPLPEVFAAHAANVEALCARGLRPHPGRDRAARLQVATEWYRHPAEKARFRRGLLPAVWAPVLMAVVGLGIAAWWA